ncbi:predicted protein [Uncinocarpus reesii 1704]|uniref:AttH domain-containing protein n=1 Tax=Uncinocarpus reesii (strain UAMH 1704) TaxID=336963 RepID=C4JU71_UNCRE|nr:uncharacterized protein UREG_06010 [Uncinocarpus reesii 1704]EEP81168.1 predicted protein [Uncinocarpus reesii 1704]
MPRLLSGLQIFLLLTLTGLTPARTLFGRDRHETIFNSSIAHGASKVQLLLGSSGFDGPKLDSVNASVYDWWYFQAMARPFSSFVIVFFTSSANAFPFLIDKDNVLPVWIWASFDNGTTIRRQTHAEVARISTLGDGSSGRYEPTGMHWSGSRDMSKYDISVDNKELGIKGTFNISLGTSPVLPCGSPKATKSMELMPNIGWANAVPFGAGDVNMNIDGSDLRFTGLAYHDKNWASVPFSQSVRSWYWGQAAIGKYVLIWFDIIPPSASNHAEYKRIHIFDKDSRRHLYSSCADDAVAARPYSKDGTPLRFPPKPGDPVPGVMRIVAETPAVDIRVVGGKRIAGDGRAYTRLFGGVEGCVYGECASEGMAIIEQMVL